MHSNKQDAFKHGRQQSLQYMRSFAAKLRSLNEARCELRPPWVAVSKDFCTNVHTGPSLSMHNWLKLALLNQKTIHSCFAV